MTFCYRFFKVSLEIGFSDNKELRSRGVGELRNGARAEAAGDDEAAASRPSTAQQSHLARNQPDLQSLSTPPPVTKAETL